MYCHTEERSDEESQTSPRFFAFALLRLRMTVLPITNRRRMKQYYVYIMANSSRTLYTGVTNDLQRRVFAHKQKLIPGYSARYNISRLVYFEATENVAAAIEREKQIKGWLRRKKLALINSVNPAWLDLSAGWYHEG
jgi:putative endonuclease